MVMDSVLYFVLEFVFAVTFFVGRFRVFYCHFFELDVVSCYFFGCLVYFHSLACTVVIDLLSSFVIIVIERCFSASCLLVFCVSLFCLDSHYCLLLLFFDQAILGVLFRLDWLLCSSLVFIGYCFHISCSVARSTICFGFTVFLEAFSFRCLVFNPCQVIDWLLFLITSLSCYYWIFAVSSFSTGVQ